MELQIDTSTRYAFVGLSVEGRSLIELSWRSERNHSVELVPAINRMLEQAGAHVADLSAVFVADGPGGFSALRVGMSTAKAIAATRSIPLVTVGTLVVEMQPYRDLGWPVCAIASAGRNRLYVGRTGEGSEGIAVQVQTYDDFLADVSNGVLYCGETVGELSERISCRVGPGSMVCGAMPPTRRASSMAHLGFGMLARGEVADPKTAEPLYLRSSQVESATRRRATSS